MNIKRELLLFLIATVLCTCVYGQIEYGITAGFTPFGKTGIRQVSKKTDSITSRFATTSPAYHLGIERHMDGPIDALTEICFSKMGFVDEANTPITNSYRFSIYRFQGVNLFYRKRVQLPIYLGFGLNYYTQLKKEKLFLDLGARARLKFYLTNRIAVFGGAYYYFGFHVNRVMERQYGVETGIIYSYSL